MTFQHLGNTLKKVLHIGIEVATDGPQKLSQLVASLLPRAQAWAQKNSINWPAEEIQKRGFRCSRYHQPDSRTVNCSASGAADRHLQTNPITGSL